MLVIMRDVEEQRIFWLKHVKLKQNQQTGWTT